MKRNESALYELALSIVTKYGYNEEEQVAGRLVRYRRAGGISGVVVKKYNIEDHIVLLGFGSHIVLAPNRPHLSEKEIGLGILICARLIEFRNEHETRCAAGLTRPIPAGQWAGTRRMR